MKIRVVGDIRVGQIQPSLTGNLIVDDTLIQNFCNTLQNECKQQSIQLDVVADHVFDINEIHSDIVIMEQEIFSILPSDCIDKNIMIIPIDRTDILWSNPSSSIQQIIAANDMLLQSAE